MAMQMNGINTYAKAGCADWLYEKQAANRAEKTKEAEKQAEEKSRGTDTDKGKGSEPQAVYSRSEKSGKQPAGLYRVGRDENGNRKIFYEDPKAGHARETNGRSKENADGRESNVNGNSQAKPAEICVGDTDQVDQEIKKLKEQKQELAQQIRSAGADEEKIQKLEKKLAQVEQELGRKDNDTYRKQHTVFSNPN